MKNDYNVILDQLMEKISKAVADEQYAEVILYNEELCKAVVEMTESCSEEDKESLYNLISDARDEIVQKEIMDEVKKSAPPIKKASGGLAYMLGE